MELIFVQNFKLITMKSTFSPVGIAITVFFTSIFYPGSASGQEPVGGTVEID